MSDKFVVRTGVLMAVGAFGAAGFLGIPEANALTGSFAAHTTIEWSGTPCIGYTASAVNNAAVEGTPGQACNANTNNEVNWTSLDEVRSYGQLVGINPILGNNTWVKCTLSINGVIKLMDYAYQGDGHDATCLKRIS